MRRITIALIVVCAIIAAIPFSWYIYNTLTVEQNANGPNCTNLFNGIENEIDKSNFCELDSDCKAIVTNHTEFGCFLYTNKGTNESSIIQEMDDYHKNCNVFTDVCPSGPCNSICFNGKCNEDCQGFPTANTSNTI